MDFLVIDDDKTFRDAMGFLIEEAGHYSETAATGEDGLARIQEAKFDGVFLDLNLGAEDGLEVLVRLLQLSPGMPTVICTAQGTVQTAVEAMRRGAVDYLEKPFERPRFLAVLARLQRLQQLGQRIENLQQEVKDTQAHEPEARFDFQTPAMRDTMEIAMKAARSAASILILGESGTGKSILAKNIHTNSALADKPFVTVSCPSLSKELLESELFGHVKGAFTGALKDHWGKVKAAQGGTLFLDEIGDLPLEVQPKLLRLLQEREYERVGETVTRQAEVRVIAATNRDLKRRVADGVFREDLFFRLNVIAVEMPPMRSRPEDLVRFAEHYVRHFAGQCSRKLKGLTPGALKCLKEYPWPGNLRELRNSIERAVILSTGELITEHDLPAEIRCEAPQPAVEASTALEGDGLISLEVLEARHIRHVLQRAKNLAEAAGILGIDHATLYRKRKRLGLA